MNYLLQGAPLDQLQILQNGHLSDVDFSKWKPVQIKGYVGQDEGMRASMAGTGEYDPNGTGEYVPENFDQFLKRKLDEVDLYNLASDAGLDISKFDKKQILMGLDVEKEHDGEQGKDVDVVKKRSDILKIVVAHLREDPKYYTKLKKVEE